MMTPRDSIFMDYADEFLQLVLQERECHNLCDLAEMAHRSPFPLAPVIVSDYRAMTKAERTAIISGFNSCGAAHIIASNPDDEPSGAHPLFDVCAQLDGPLKLQHPFPFPLEGHPEAVKRFGKNDGTFKVYDLPKPIDGPAYREIAETSEKFDVHVDGLGFGGAVETFILWMDSAPLFGGFGFLYDMFAIGAALAEEDMVAFRHLFVPDAFATIRPRGKGAIKVVSPVLYLDELGRPHVHFRKNAGEYQMHWRTGCPALDRARTYLHRYTEPFSPGSYFVPFTRPGCAVICRNRDIAHGRTNFVDGTLPHQRRVLSRKWFMTTKDAMVYKHVPGLAMRSDIVKLAPELFGIEQLNGQWLYDPVQDQNIQVS